MPAPPADSAPEPTSSLVLARTNVRPVAFTVAPSPI